MQAAALAGHNQLVVHRFQGFNPRNLRARAAFGCVGARQDMETIGVVSALADAEEISEIIATFQLNRVIVTGLDMAGRCGALAAAVTARRQPGACLALARRRRAAGIPEPAHWQLL